MKFFFPLLLTGIFLFACRVDAPEKTDQELNLQKVWQDSMARQTELFYNRYYDYELDSAQIMTLLDSLATETEQKLGKDNLAIADIQHTRGKVYYQESDYPGAILAYRHALDIRKRFLDKIN